jgi:F420-dependent methylenetetrahydromethanopterin dehydrogenase
VPGIPEAKNQTEALEALFRFRIQILVRLNPAMQAVEAARRKDIQFPDPIVIGLFKNDLVATVASAKEYRLSVEEIDQAIRHIKSHIPVGEIQQLLRKWGAR